LTQPADFFLWEFVFFSSEELHVFGMQLILFVRYASLCDLYSKETLGMER
jgi:hypothetical protein